MDIQWIKEQVSTGNYELKLHAAERASLRGIDPLEIKEVLLNGEILENYPLSANMSETLTRLEFSVE